MLVLHVSSLLFSGCIELAKETHMRTAVTVCLWSSAHQGIMKLTLWSQYPLTLRAPRATLVDKNFLPLSATGDFSRHEERAAYRRVKHWPLYALVT